MVKALTFDQISTLIVQLGPPGASTWPVKLGIFHAVMGTRTPNAEGETHDAKTQFRGRSAGAFRLLGQFVEIPMGGTVLRRTR
jgi:hypothetical protein